MFHYPDFIQRMLIQPRMLTDLIVRDVSNYEALFRIRDAGDADLTGDTEPAAPAIIPLLRAALFYWVDAVNEAAPIFNASEETAAIYWQGMCARRSGDFAVARDAFRSISAHAAYPELHRSASDLGADFARQSSWDPYLFTGLCEQHRFGADELGDMLRALQMAEFEIMFADLWRRLG